MDNINFLQAIEISQKVEIQKEEDKTDFQNRLSEAHDEFNEIVNSNQHFTYADIEDMMLGYGLEMDYIEDFI